VGGDRDVLAGLTPPERRAGRWVLRSRAQKARPGRDVYDINYGDRATVLIAVGFILVMLGGGIAMTGILLVAFAPSNGVIGPDLILAGMAPVGLAAVRITQAARATRTFRGGRPFVKP
jgi:hypothetical protein